MDPNKDYYAILGVHPTAEKAVIDAAYKALAKRYHPDMNQDNPDEAKSRMQEINEAYEVLSDATKRKEYDDLKGDGTQQGEEYFRGEEEDEPNYDPLEGNWKVALDYYPDLEIHYNQLKLISWKLGYGYKAFMLETKNYEKREIISKNMERDFLERYFGDNDEIVLYAKNLILMKQKLASKELNKVVSVLGLSKKTKSEEISKVKNKINKKYNLRFNTKKKEYEKKSENYSNHESNSSLCNNCNKNVKMSNSQFCCIECEREFIESGIFKKEKIPNGLKYFLIISLMIAFVTFISNL